MVYNIGDRIGDYQIVDVLGAGGMGKVYKVRNVISERVEALKVLLPNLQSDPDLADRFMREIKVQASLQHPNIAALHTALRVDNQLLMLIEFVEGITVEQELKKGPLPVEKAADYVRQVLLALSYAHSHGVVHRDIKPANMMLMADGTVKLMDFGIARLSADRRLTQTGRTVGSLYYMSPEQIQGALDLDARSDLYSLGVTLYELVTARRPFQGDSDYSIMAAHLSARPVPPIEIDPSLPAALNDVILTAIAKDPGRRFQSADAFRTALQSVPATPVAVTPETRRVELPPHAVAGAPSRGRRGLYMGLGSAVAVAVLAVAALLGPRLFEAPAASSRDPVAAQTPIPQSAPRSPEQGMSTPQPSLEPVTLPETPRKQEPVRMTQRVSSPQSTRVEQQNAGPSTAGQSPSSAAQTRVPLPNTAPSPADAAPSPVSVPSEVPAYTSARDAIEPLRELLMLLGTRANSTKEGLDSMKQQQARMGVGMRQDVLTAEQRMEYYLDDAEAAMKAGDAPRMKKSLQSAERALEAIEKFLGR